MEVTVPTLLLLLWLKTLLNWVVVLLQWPHVVWTFTGFFCLSLALTDTLRDIVVTLVFLAEGFTILNIRITVYHICLLVQISGLVYGVLQWPAFLLVGLDTYWMASTKPCWAQRLSYIFGTLLLWILATYYVLVRPDSSPVMGDDLHLQLCKVTRSFQSSQVAAVLLLVVASVLLYTRKSQDDLRHSVYTFLSTWRSFLVLLVLLLGFQLEIPAYLDMNVPWICLLHSFFNMLSLSSCSCRLCSETREHFGKR